VKKYTSDLNFQNIAHRQNKYCTIAATTQLKGGGGDQKMVKQFIDHHPPKVTE